MKITFKIDKDRNFLALIHNLNRKNNPQEYEIRDLLKDYKIPDEMRKIIRKIISKEGDLLKEIEQNPMLNKIYVSNKEIWEDYWEKNKIFIEKIKKELEKKIDKFDLSKFEECAKFFESEMPNEITIYLCAGAINEVGKGTGMSDYTYIMFPRKFNSYNEITISYDFAVIIHEIVHVMQNKIYYNEDREFIEAVTRTFAPRGILINYDKIDKNTPEEKMIPVIERAIQEGKTYKKIRNELLKLL